MRPMQELVPLANPKRDPAWSAYLEFLLEYRPEETLTLFSQGKLESLLDEKATQIANCEERLIRAGTDRDAAQEIAYEEFMPAATDLPEQEMLEPIWEIEQRRILAWANALRSRPRR